MSESTRHTAIREALEESDGFFGDRRNLSRLLDESLIDVIEMAGYKTYVVVVDYDRAAPRRFRERFLSVKKEHPRLLGVGGRYEKDMLRWVRQDKLRAFLPKLRPWYVKFAKEIARTTYTK